MDGTEQRNLYVSIHAPREGCDLGRTTLLRQKMGFNSRTPGGVRLVDEAKVATKISFQFTHPGRGATLPALSVRSSQLFQFTHPGRGATSTRSIRAAFAIVSIHAPREGCDCSPTQM